MGIRLAPDVSGLDFRDNGDQNEALLPNLRHPNTEAGHVRIHNFVSLALSLERLELTISQSIARQFSLWATPGQQNA